MTTLIPGYPAVLAAVKGGKVVHRWRDLIGHRGAAARGDDRRIIPLLVLDAPTLFARDGGLYGHDDDWRRFAALARRRGADLGGRRGRRAAGSTCSMRMTGRRRWPPPICAMRRRRGAERS